MNPLTFRRRRRAERDRAHAAFLSERRLVTEDVTVFGEEMSELHLETLTDVLTDDARDHYRFALGSYERAKSGLDAAETSADLAPVVESLVDGRHQRACVLAVLAGEPTPAKLEECFFNPQHGPSSARVSWTPMGGVARVVAVCAADARRLAAGQAPKVRLVRVGDRYVPWHEAADDSGYLPPRIDGVSVRDRIGMAQGRGALYGFDPPNNDGGLGL